jgi:hypothetical protein
MIWVSLLLVIFAGSQDLANQEEGLIQEVSIVGQPMKFDEIETVQENFSFVDTASEEGKTWIVMNVEIAFTKASSVIYFDQISLVTKTGDEIPLAYFTLKQDFGGDSNMPFSTITKKGGTFYQMVDGESVQIMQFVVSESDEDRAGLLFSREKEIICLAFQMDKGASGLSLVIGDHTITLK